MATLDLGPRQRDTLPPISHLDLDVIKSDSNGHSRFGMLNGLSISTAPMSSPTTTMYSGPPPPYSCAPSTAGSASGLSGYISPPESTTRRSTRDERESPGLRKSLPSIHEALGDRSMSLSGPLSSASQQQQQQPPPLATPTTTVGQSFPDGPKGPANPFSQPPGPAPVLRDVFSGPPKNVPVDKPPIPSTDPRQPVSQHFGYPGSPPSQPPPTAFRSSALANTSFGNHNDHLQATSPQSYDAPKPQYPLPQFGASATANGVPPHDPVQFGARVKADLQRPPYTRAEDAQFSDSVKRHLDVFDAELGFNEISEASAGTLDFARVWAPRFHHGTRSGYFHEALPSVAEMDEALRQSYRIFENLTHLRELAIAQHNALSEHRARQAEEYRGLPDAYRNPNLPDRAEREAKKHRRGAAPPGRCHSCNRAETPEWRRGPDGARTLCNACGLHYAKLTRKMGVNKAATLTGSSLRPKHLDQTRP